MIGTTGELMREIGASLVRTAPDGWLKMELHITSAGGMTQTTVDGHRSDGSIDTSCALDRPGRVAAHEIREAMHQPGKGTWYNARFTLTPDGNLESEFDYDNPPFEGDADEALLIDDQERFPRVPENLPDWHPSRPTD